MKKAIIVAVMDIYELLGKKSPDKIRLEIAKRFKECRKYKHITQIELSEKTGVSYASIKKFEQTGLISFESLLLISEALDLLSDFDELFKINNHLSYEDLANGR